MPVHYRGKTILKWSSMSRETHFEAQLNIEGNPFWSAVRYQGNPSFFTNSFLDHGSIPRKAHLKAWLVSKHGSSSKKISFEAEASRYRGKTNFRRNLMSRETAFWSAVKFRGKSILKRKFVAEENWHFEISAVRWRGKPILKRSSKPTKTNFVARCDAEN